VESGVQVTIVSSDKDMMQLVRPGVDMLDPIKYKPIGDAEVKERFGVGPDRVVDVQALIGDSVDNVPGVPGIGPTAASAVINKFGNLAGVLKAVKDAEKFAAAFKSDADEAEKQITKLLGRPCKFGPTSKDLGTILFDELKIPGAQRDKKGNWDVGNDALQALSKRTRSSRSSWNAARSRAPRVPPLAGGKDRQEPGAAEMSLRLVQLKDDCELPLKVEAFRIKKPIPRSCCRS